jgi:hypothetical protein
VSTPAAQSASYRVSDREYLTVTPREAGSDTPCPSLTLTDTYGDPETDGSRAQSGARARLPTALDLCLSRPLSIHDEGAGAGPFRPGSSG